MTLLQTLIQSFWLLRIVTEQLFSDLRQIKNGIPVVMSFNPDPSKQAKDVIFSCSNENINHCPINFKETAVNQVSQQKDSDVILDMSESSEDHIITISSKQ